MSQANSDNSVRVGKTSVKDRKEKGESSRDKYLRLFGFSQFQLINLFSVRVRYLDYLALQLCTLTFMSPPLLKEGCERKIDLPKFK